MYLMHDLISLELWDEGMMNKIKAENGSIQNIAEIPANIKELYKTVWEISQKILQKILRKGSTNRFR